MGRRTRKRVVGGAPGAPVATDGPAPARGSARPSARARARGAAPHPRTPDRRARAAERPRAPWAPFPLVELCILAGIICIVVGFAGGAEDVPWLIAGFALVSLAGVAVAVHEHLAGFRSHSALLAAALAVALAAAASLLSAVPQPVILVLAVVAFGIAFGALRELFRRRAGGLGFRA